MKGIIMFDESDENTGAAATDAAGDSTAPAEETQTADEAPGASDA